MGGAPELWDVEVLPSARRELRKLPNPEREEFLDILEELKEGPYLPGIQKLRSYHHRFKIRFGRGERFRIFADILPGARKVLVTTIVLRGRDTYSGMDKW